MISSFVWGQSIRQARWRPRARHAPSGAREILAAKPQSPAVALSDADIFFYPLQPDHYGTAENALIEAMSLGLTPGRA